MKELIVEITEYSSYQLIASVFTKKGGLIIDITGPNDHLGGVGVGIPYIRKNGDESANFHCISFPSHRDGELAGILARAIAKITCHHTVVLLGVHFPDLSKSQLDDLIRFFKEWAIYLGQQILTKLPKI
ncbi:MAG: hypothetical protein ACFE9L_06540 [Candidatus Hodarchaeota archaeon]